MIQSQKHFLQAGQRVDTVEDDEVDEVEVVVEAGVADEVEDSSHHDRRRNKTLRQSQGFLISRI